MMPRSVQSFPRPRLSKLSIPLPIWAVQTHSFNVPSQPTALYRHREEKTQLFPHGIFAIICFTACFDLTHFGDRVKASFCEADHSRWQRWLVYFLHDL